MDPKETQNEEYKISSCDEDEYIVEKIIDKKVTDNGQILYFIKWKDWPSAFNTWEPVENCKCPDLIEEYEQNVARKYSSQTKSSIKKNTKKKNTRDSNSKSFSQDFSRTKTDPCLNRNDKLFISEDTSTKNSSTYSSKGEEDKNSIKINKKKAKEKDFMSNECFLEKMEGMQEKTSILYNTTLPSSSFLTSLEGDQENVDDKKFGFEQGHELETLLGVNVINNQLLFYVKYANECYPNELIPASICNEKWPDKVIEFYEARLLTMRDDIDLEVLWKEVNDNKSRTHPRNM